MLVGEILKRAGAPLGTELRGNAIASYVLASATDGYQVLFSLAELDPGVHEQRRSSSPTPSTASRCSPIRARCGSSRRRTRAAARSIRMLRAARGRAPQEVAIDATMPR